MGDEFRALIRDNVGGNSMLGEHMEKKELCKLQRCDCVMCRDEYALFGETIHYHADHGESRGWRDLFYEVHGDGVPGFLWDGKLLQQSIGLIPWNLCMGTGGAGQDVVLYKCAYSWPSVFAVY